MPEDYEGNCQVKLDRGIKNPKSYFEKMAQTKYSSHTKIRVSPQEFEECQEFFPKHPPVEIQFPNLKEYQEFLEAHPGKTYLSRILPEYENNGKLITTVINMTQNRHLIENQNLDLSNVNVKISAMGEIDVAMAQKLKEQGLETILLENQNDSDSYPDGYETVPIDKYIEARKKLDKMKAFVDAELPSDDDSHREKKIFRRICEVIANTTTYNYFGANYFQWQEYYKAHETPEELNDFIKRYREANKASTSAIEGFIRGECTCGGLSEMPRHLASCYKIHSRTVGGRTKIKEKNGDIYGGGHAWIQAYLDGVWLNTDLTYDLDRYKAGMPPKNLMKSDKTFGHHDYSEHRSKMMPCPKDLTPEEYEECCLGKRANAQEKMQYYMDNAKLITNMTVSHVMIELYDRFHIGREETRKMTERLKQERKKQKEVQTPTQDSPSIGE